VITLVLRRLLKPLALLVGGFLLSGCSGEENIPLKKVDFVLDAPPATYKEKRPQYTHKGASSKIGHDPSGINKDQAQQ
jgi:hypothetical protein